MSNPVNSAIYGHRSQFWALNTTSGSQAAIDRVQSVDPSFNIRSDPYYELGRKGKVGTTQHPPEYRVVTEQNMTDNMELEWILAGKNIAPAGAQSYNLGDILTYSGAYRGYLLNLNQSADTVLNELEINGMSVAEMNFRFTVGGAITQSFSFVGTGGKLYTTGNTVHSAFQTADTTSLGGIHGKDARIWFTSGSAAANRTFRLQNFNIRAVFPTVYVRELGNRSLVGTLADAPDVTMDFDLLVADDQPTDKFFTLSGTFYDYATPLAAFNTFVRVFDPNNTEAGSTVKMFKIENCLPTAHTPIRAAVRSLATSRYSITASKESISNAGTLIISNRNDLS